MTRCRWCLLGTPLVLLSVAIAVMAVPPPTPILAQTIVKKELPLELRFVPPDAAIFVHADAPALWGDDVVKSVRKADARLFADLVEEGKKGFGLTPDDVKSLVLFVPKLKDPLDTERLGLIVTLNKPYDVKQLQEGADKLLPNSAKPRVVAVNDRTALVLIGLGEEYEKPRTAGATGPLSAAIQEAATGKHAVVIGVTLGSIPEEIRDDLPVQLRPFLPLVRAQTITAYLDLGKTIDLDVRVKTATAGQAVECEKSLGAVLAMIQNEAGEALSHFDLAKEPGLKDLVAVMKAGVASAKDAKFTTLGTETRMTVSLPTNLPFVGAYVAAKQKAVDAAASVKSANNLKQIALAMHNYESAHENFPPAAICDKNGKPMLSWRVLILPYIEQNNLYKEFKLDEPWDSDHNKKLIAKMPNLYAMPGKSKPGDTTTYYRVFVGNGSGFDWIMGGKIAAYADGTSNTWMCVTAAEAVPWTKPDELEFDPEKDMGKFIGTLANGTAQAAYFDGSVRAFAKIPAKQTLNALITRAGGEVIPADFDK